MPPPSQQDPFGGQGPFDQFINPVQAAVQSAPQWDRGQQFNGFEGGLGKSLGVFSKVLQGVTQGRISAFAQKEQKKAMAFGQVTALHDQLQSLDVDPIKREAANQLYAQMLAKRVGTDMKDAGAHKDKGVAGHIGGVFANALDHLAGGPFTKSGEPTPEDYAQYMGMANDLMKDHNGGPTARAGQMALYREGKREVDEQVKQTGGYVASREDYLSNPKVSGVLDWFNRYDKPGAAQLNQVISNTPNTGSPEYNRAALSGFDRTHGVEMQPATPLLPPPTRGEAGMIPMQPGYLEAHRQGLQAPPQSVVRLPQGDPEQTVPIVGAERVGPPPEVKPLSPELEAMRAHLVEQAGYGPKAERLIWATNPFTHTVDQVPVSQGQAWDRETQRQLAARKVQDLATERSANASRWLKTFEDNHKYRQDKLSQNERALENAESSTGVRWAEHNLHNTEFTEKNAPMIAMSRLMMWAAGRGIKPSEFIDNQDKLQDAFDDPDISPYRAQIADQINRQKGRLKTDTWAQFGQMMGMAAPPPEKPQAAAPQVAAPPAARTPKAAPAAAPAAAPHPVTSRIAGALRLDGAAPPAAAPAGGAAPRKVFNVTTGRFDDAAPAVPGAR